MKTMTQTDSGVFVVVQVFAVFFMSILDNFVHAIQVMGGVAVLISALLSAAWFLSLHIDKIKEKHGGDIWSYVKSFKTRK